MSLHYLGKCEPPKLHLFSHAEYSPRPPTLSDRNEILRGCWSSEDSFEVWIWSKSFKQFQSCGQSKFALSRWFGQINEKMAKSVGNGKFWLPTAPKPLNWLWFKPQNYLLKTSHHAKFHFDPMTSVVSVNAKHDWKDVISGFTFPQVAQRH